MTDSAAPHPASATPPAGASNLLRRRMGWLAGYSLILVALAAIAAALLPFGNAYGAVIVGCGFAAFFVAIFLWVGFWSWYELRREMNSVLRSETLARWICPEDHWNLIDQRRKTGEPLGEICLTPYAVFVGSTARNVLFVQWRSGRKHLSVAEVQIGNPSILRIEVSVPSSGRVPGYRIPIALPIPLEQREGVEAAVAHLQGSDAVRPKGESRFDLLLLIAGGGILAAAILSKLGIIRW